MVIVDWGYRSFKGPISPSIETPTSVEINRLLYRISGRIAHLLERHGYWEREEEEGSLILEGFEDDVINHLQSSSITYRIAIGPSSRQKGLNVKEIA